MKLMILFVFAAAFLSSTLLWAELPRKDEAEFCKKLSGKKKQEHVSLVFKDLGSQRSNLCFPKLPGVALPVAGIPTQDIGFAVRSKIGGLGLSDTAREQLMAELYNTYTGIIREVGDCAARGKKGTWTAGIDASSTAPKVTCRGDNARWLAEKIKKAREVDARLSKMISNQKTLLFDKTDDDGNTVGDRTDSALLSYIGGSMAKEERFTIMDETVLKRLGIQDVECSVKNFECEVRVSPKPSEKTTRGDAVDDSATAKKNVSTAGSDEGSSKAKKPAVQDGNLVD